MKGFRGLFSFGPRLPRVCCLVFIDISVPCCVLPQAVASAYSTLSFWSPKTVSFKMLLMSQQPCPHSVPQPLAALASMEFVPFFKNGIAYFLVGFSLLIYTLIKVVLGAGEMVQQFESACSSRGPELSSHYPQQTAHNSLELSNCSFRGSNTPL